MIKYSVIVALAGVAVIVSVDLFTNGSVNASKEIAIALIAFAGIRQAIGMKTGK